MFSFFRPPSTYWSDPRFMSLLIDPKYPRRNKKGQLCLVPNVYNPQRPVAVDVPPQKLPALYQLLLTDEVPTDQQQQQLSASEEERLLYSGSTNPLPAEW